MSRNPLRPRPPAPRRPSGAGIAVAAAVLLALAGCGGDRAPGDDDAPGRTFLSLGTAPPGGAFFVVGGALAEVLDAHPGDPAGSRWRVTAEATKGTQENIRRLDRRELDFALANSAITYFALRGEAEWERPYPVRAVMTLAPNVALFVAPAGAGVRGLADLKGRRVVVGPAGAGFETFLRPILAAHGLALEDLAPIFATQAAAVDLLSDGSADAAFLGGAVPTASLTQAAASMELVFLPYDPAAVAGLVERYPFFQPATIPAGTYRGLDADFHGLDVGSMHLITAAGEDEERVYRVAKILWEHRAEVVERHAAGRAIRAEVVARDLGTPFHPGAERLYREIGAWPGG
jgi:TRAP transporter TAXI family solute receptor